MQPLPAQLMQEYADAGMTGRIMFGSDGGAYKQAFAAYESAEFLTNQQLEGIFCRNAERFLKKRGFCDYPTKLLARTNAAVMTGGAHVFSS